MVYCIRCSRCGLLYIGETKRRLGDHFVEHLCSVRDKRQTTNDNTFQSQITSTHPSTPWATCPSWASSSVTMTPPGNWRSSTSYSASGGYSPM
eukprot:g44547.t1